MILTREVQAAYPVGYGYQLPYPLNTVRLAYSLHYLTLRISVQIPTLFTESQAIIVECRGCYCLDARALHKFGRWAAWEYPHTAHEGVHGHIAYMHVN